MADRFDLVVLGGGTGGYSAALRAAGLGMSVALVEKDKVGGTCLHWGCIPTKALLHSAEVYDTVGEASKYGVSAGEPSYDWGGVQSFKDGVVGKMFKGLEGLLKHRKVEVISGEAKMTSPSQIKVGDRTLDAGAIVVATGSVPKMLPGLSAGPRVWTSNEALFNPVPRSAIVLGAGSVGVEFASIWRSFGAEVTVVEMLPGLVPLEDPDLGKELGRQYTKRGIGVRTGAKMEDVKVTDDSVTATISTNGKSETIEAEVLLVAVGRRAVSETANLDGVGIAIDQRGFVEVDAALRTNLENVYAIGDCINTPGLAHVSFAEGFFVAETLGGKSPPAINYDAIPRATYSNPEVGAVGMTEAEARERGADVVTAKVSLAAIGKAQILGDPNGFCKLVADKGGALLGAHFIGPRVTELIAEAMLSIGWEAMPDEVAQLIHPHPSLSEVFGEASLALAGRALHTA